MKDTVKKFKRYLQHLTDDQKKELLVKVSNDYLESCKILVDRERQTKEDS